MYRVQNITYKENFKYIKWIIKHLFFTKWVTVLGDKIWTGSKFQRKGSTKKGGVWRTSKSPLILICLFFVTPFMKFCTKLFYILVVKRVTLTMNELQWMLRKWNDIPVKEMKWHTCLWRLRFGSRLGITIK